jgi:polysaccharide export outer membrane protein
MGKTMLPPPDPAANALRPLADNYVVGPQDTIEVEVFQTPELTKTVIVDDSGMILLPLIGKVQAAGATTEALSARIAKSFEETYVKDPVVTVTVKKSESQRITVDGAVVQPGIYPLTGTTTLLQAVALARGPDVREANIKKVAIFRQIGGQRQSAIYNLAAIRSGKEADPQVYANDIVVVETSGSRGILRDLGSALPILSVFRWGY